jgi:hypothetical protein
MATIKAMSIASTVAALERANAAYKAAQATTNAPAKRDMFALVEREHRYSYLWDGIVKEVRLAGQSWPLKRRDWRQINVDSASKIADPEAVTRRLVDENGHAREFRDQREAIAAVKAAAGLS